jgi:sulfate transport system ATP-binding protein
MSIAVKCVTKHFGNFVALRDVSLDVPGGSLVALIGPSGSGKTTLLRIIAGLESPDHGSVLYQDEDITQQSARDRNMGFVFQHYALFRHLSVFENIAFGLRIRKWSEDKIRARVQELLHLIRLAGYDRRLPSELSGGQRQRVALARALAVQPRVLLLDEPFGALDAKVRQELRQWLRRLHDEIHMTSVFVTHDQEEAFEVADSVIVMRDGKVEQAGTPQEVFDHPANGFVMDFLGNVNVFHGRMVEDLFHNGLKQTTHGGVLDMSFCGTAPPPTGPTTVYVRPHELEVTMYPNGRGSLPTRVIHINPTSGVARLQLLMEDGAIIRAELSLASYSEMGVRVGDTVYVSPRRARVFNADTGRYIDDGSPIVHVDRQR